MPILKPFVWLKSIFQYKNFEYIFLVLFLIVFYIRGGWKALIFAFPTFYMVMLPEYIGLTDPKNQYGGEILIPLCICGFYGLRYLFSKTSFQNSEIFQRSVLSLSVFVFLCFLFINPIRKLKFFIGSKDAISFAYKLQAIPTDQLIMTNTISSFPFIANIVGMYIVKNLSQYKEEETKKMNYFVFEGEVNKDFYIPSNTKLIEKYKNFYLYEKEKNDMSSESFFN